MKFSLAQIKQYFEGVFEGIYSGFQPSKDLFIATAEYLDEGLFKGFGEVLFDMDKKDPDFLIAKELRDNVHVFSAFKSHHSAADLGALIFDKNGGKRAFKNFEADALEYFEIVHNRHLKTEYRTSVANARGAKQWQEITRNVEVFPFLQYSTVGDERVRPDHEDYDQVTLPAKNPFWLKYMPPNGFNCRCDVNTLTGLESGFKTSKKAFIENLAPPPELFQMNPGVDKVIFSPKHPAFTVADRYKVAAKSAFDLPLLFGKHKNP